MKKYQIIYADPPWQYKNGGKGKLTGLAEHHYNTLTKEEIKQLEIGKSFDDSVLFMWATYPQLSEALEVIKAWGYTYKTVAFTWIKTYPKNKNLVVGLGFWTRSNAEICLLATKGKNYPRRISMQVQQVLISPRGKHSEKPNEIRKRIVHLLGDIPRIELFARQKTEGWDVWGNELTNDI